MAISVDELARSLPESLFQELVGLVLDKCRKQTMPKESFDDKPDFHQLAACALGVTREDLQQYMVGNRELDVFTPSRILEAAKKFDREGALRLASSKQLDTLVTWLQTAV